MRLPAASIDAFASAVRPSSWRQLAAPASSTPASTLGARVSSAWPRIAASISGQGPSGKVPGQARSKPAVGIEATAAGTQALRRCPERGVETGERDAALDVPPGRFRGLHGPALQRHRRLGHFEPRAAHLDPGAGDAGVEPQMHGAQGAVRGQAPFSAPRTSTAPLAFGSERNAIEPPSVQAGARASSAEASTAARTASSAQPSAFQRPVPVRRPAPPPPVPSSASNACSSRLRKSSGRARNTASRRRSGRRPASQRPAAVFARWTSTRPGVSADRVRASALPLRRVAGNAACSADRSKSASARSRSPSGQGADACRPARASSVCGGWPEVPVARTLACSRSSASGPDASTRACQGGRSCTASWLAWSCASTARGGRVPMRA